jgi:hypothetical protein
MAHLNVRERRIETKIAYIGRDVADTHLHLKHLVSIAKTHDVELDRESGDILSLEWRPPRLDASSSSSAASSSSTMSDCDVAVKVIARSSTAALDQDVDGVVLLAPEDPGSAADALKVPHVVQAEGENVLASLETLLARVMEGMKKSATLPGLVAPMANAAAPTAAPTVMDQNPLLSALREVLRDAVRETVTSHMAEVEKETASRIAQAVARRDDGRDDETRRAMQELRSMITTTVKETARALAAQSSALTDISARVAEIHAATLDLVSRRDLAATETHLRDEINARARAEREHLTNALAILRRGLDAITLDLKKADLREKKLQDVAAELHNVSAKLDAVNSTLEPTAVSVGMVPTRISSINEVVQREVREIVLPKLARLEDSVQVLHVDTGESLQRAEQRAGEIQGGLNELLEELKRRKKGWFS